MPDPATDPTEGGARRTYPRMLWAALGVVVVAAVVATILLMGGRDDETSAPPVDTRLVADIEETGLTPYVIDLRDAEIVDVSAEPHPDDLRPPIEISYELGDGTPFSVYLLPTPRKPSPCKPDDGEGGTCEVIDGVEVSTFEEMSSAAKTFGGTRIAVDFVSESDPEIIDDVVAAVRGATEVTARELAAAPD